MPKRELRVVKYIGPAPYLGVCTNCNQQFRVISGAIFTEGDAWNMLNGQFEAHECKPEDASQAAARIVREATKS